MTQNLIHSDGHVEGLEISAGETLRFWDLDPTLTPWHPGTPPMGDIPIVAEAATSIDPAGTMRGVFEGDEWGSTITFEPGIPVMLGGTLELRFDDDVNPASLVGTTYQLFDWTGVSTTGPFDLILTQNGLL